MSLNLRSGMTTGTVATVLSFIYPSANALPNQHNNLFESENPQKEITYKHAIPSIDNLSQKSNNHQLTTRNTSPLYTQTQLHCSENLGVDYSECNTHGVFINRTEIIANEILNQLHVSSWNEVTESMLHDIKLLDLSHKGISSLHELDFNGLVNLQTLALNDNQITELPKSLFKELHKLNYIRLQNNKIETFSENLFDDLPIRRLEVYDNPLVIPFSVFAKLMQRPYCVRIFNTRKGIYDPKKSASLSVNGKSYVLETLRELFGYGENNNIRYIFPNYLAPFKFVETNGYQENFLCEETRECFEALGPDYAHIIQLGSVCGPKPIIEKSEYNDISGCQDHVSSVEETIIDRNILGWCKPSHIIFPAQGFAESTISTNDEIAQAQRLAVSKNSNVIHNANTLFVLALACLASLYANNYR